ncbi:MAG: hypothetical protein QXR58_02380 [Candidatus Micrarchaeaceae archaeon]
MKASTVVYALAICAALLIFIYVNEMSDLALPYAPRNFPTTPSQNSPNATTISYVQEMKNANALGYNFTAESFACSSQKSCIKVQIAPCFNGLPNQVACINPAAYPSYIIHKESISKYVFCPYFIIEGKESCSCISGYCAELYAK